MISEITQALVDRIAMVPALADRVGTTLGGTEADPTMTSVPVPAAWVVFESSQDVSHGDGRSGADSRYQKLQLTYRVVLVLQYGEGETDLKIQLKTIEDIASAVRGTIPIAIGAEPWAYQGCTLLSVETGRIAYALSFQTLAYYKTTP